MSCWDVVAFALMFVYGWAIAKYVAHGDLRDGKSRRGGGDNLASAFNKSLQSAVGGSSVPAIVALPAKEYQLPILLGYAVGFLLTFVAENLLRGKDLGDDAFQKHLARGIPRSRCKIEAKKWKTRVWRDGYYSACQELEKQYPLQDIAETRYEGIRLEFNQSLRFFSAIADGIATDALEDDEVNIEKFLNNIESYMERCLQLFFERGADLVRCRACIYYLPPNADEAKFLVGVETNDKPYTFRSLPRASLVGEVLAKNKREILRKSKSKKWDNSRGCDVKECLACKMKPLTPNKRPPTLDAALCVDLLEDGLDDREGYKDQIILALAQYLDDAFGVQKLTPEIVDAYLDQRDKSLSTIH